MDEIAVLIPCYNEARTIEKVINDFRIALPEAQIYVYDNNSTDGTADLALAAGAVVRHEYKQGKGNVVRRMFQEINAQCYIITDGDDTYPAEAAREMAEKVIKQNADMVVGDRLSSTYFQENKRPFHNFGNSLVRMCINKIFKSNIKDIMTGYRAFSRRFVKCFPVLSRGFEIETEMTICAIFMNMQIDNVIVTYRDRPLGSESKLSTVRDGIKVLLTIFDLFKNYRPLQFFGLIGIIMIIIDALIFVPVVLVPYINTSMVEHFPTLIVCGFIGISALLSMSIGLVLDSMVQRERRDFEFKLMLAEDLGREK